MANRETGAGPRVVAGVTDHPESTQTLWWAVAESAATHRPLVVAFGCAPESALATPGGAPRTAVLELAEPFLAGAVAAARAQLGGDRVSVVVRPDPPGALLVGLTGPSDLLVVGASRRVGWSRRRSTAHHVLHHARCPVVVVKPRPESGPYASFEGTVVVGVDGSPTSRAALEFAFAYAAEHRRTLVAVNATDQHDYDLWYDDQFLETHLTTQPRSLDLLATEVEGWERKYPGVRVRRAVFGGPPVEGLLRAAHGAALLVVGDRGNGAVRRALLGSVSEAVVERSDCPVAIIRSS